MKISTRHASLALLCSGATVLAAHAADPPPPPTATELSKITVQEATDTDYVVSKSSSALKTDAPLLDTAMAVQVISAAVIEDRQIRTALEAVQTVSGVQPSFYEFYDQFLIRGFDSGYGSSFRNGLQQRGITESVNMAFVDHIEVVKGPASMLYGRIEPGGFVNIVTKKPLDTAQYAAQLEAGSWGAWRSTLDATGPLDRAGIWRYRVIGNLDKADSWVDNAHRDNKAVAASVSFTPTSAFDATLEFEHYATKTSWLDASVPVVGNRPAPVSRHFSILYPDSWNLYPYDTRRDLVSIEGHYRFSGSWSLAARAHYVTSNESQQGVYADGFDGVSQFTAVRFTHSAPDWKRTSLNANLDLSGEFSTGTWKHHLLLGADTSSFNDDTPGSTGDITGAAPLDIFHPVYPTYAAVLAALSQTDASNTLWRDRAKDSGVYVQDQIEPAARWRILLGARYDVAQDGYPDTYGSRDAACYPNCTALPIAYFPKDHAFSPRAGLLFKASSSVSLYASYAHSFGSTNGYDANGHYVSPQIGTQYELGAKYASADGRMTASATAYQLTKTNIPEYDPVNFFPHYVGEARSRGLELDVSGQLTRNLSVQASYTLNQTVITDDPVSGTQGNRLSGAAPQFSNVWLKYDVTPDVASGWSLGVGAYASAQRQGDDQNTWQLPGYARFDAMASYRHPIGKALLTAHLNVVNLLDRMYFDHGGYGFAAYGAPRTVQGAVRVEF
jgi:iron complex outermembrane receptor protein